MKIDKIKTYKPVLQSTPTKNKEDEMDNLQIKYAIGEKEAEAVKRLNRKHLMGWWA